MKTTTIRNKNNLKVPKTTKKQKHVDVEQIYAEHLIKEVDATHKSLMTVIYGCKQMSHHLSNLYNDMMAAVIAYNSAQQHKHLIVHDEVLEQSTDDEPSEPEPVTKTCEVQTDGEFVDSLFV